MTAPPDAASAARAVADELERAGIPYAIGGAIAFGLHAAPRATNDVDVNVFAEAAEAGPAFDALVAAGCDVDREAALRSANARGDAQATWRGLRVDVFFVSIPQQSAAARRVRTATLGGRPIRVLAPEDLALFKLLFFRSKDVLDLERLVAALGRDLDCEGVRQTLVEILGESDERVGRWDHIVATFRR